MLMDDVTSTAQFSNYTMYILNIVIAICGVALLVFGVIHHIKENKEVAAFSDFSLGLLAIAVGVIVFLVAAAGCLGWYWDKMWLLIIYASFLIGFFALQLTFGIIAVDKNLRGDILPDVKQVMLELFGRDDMESIQAFHRIELEFNCCGVNNYMLDYPSGLGGGYPSSCCGNETPCINPYKTGCVRAYTKVMEKYVVIIGTVLVASSFVELLAAVLTLMKIRYKDYYRMHSCCGCFRY